MITSHSVRTPLSACIIAPPLVFAPGLHLGSYEVIAQIGVGTIGDVYRATDSKMKRQVAARSLQPALTLTLTDWRAFSARREESPS